VKRPALPNGRRHLLSGRFRGRPLAASPARTRHFIDVARNKVARGTKSPLRDNAVVQSNLAQAEVNLRAARGFVLQSMADIWKDLCCRRHPSTVEQRITVRMAATPRYSQGARGGRPSPTMPQARPRSSKPIRWSAVSATSTP